MKKMEMKEKELELRQVELGHQIEKLYIEEEERKQCFKLELEERSVGV